MARSVKGRILPTFLPASPCEEKKPNLEELMENLIKTQQRIARSLQRFEGSLSQDKKEKWGISAKEGSKGLYEEFCLEGGKATITDQHKRDHEQSSIQL